MTAILEIYLFGMEAKPQIFLQIPIDHRGDPLEEVPVLVDDNDIVDIAAVVAAPQLFLDEMVEVVEVEVAEQL